MEDHGVYTKQYARELAEAAIREERFRSQVEIEKARLRERKPWWHKVFPFKITITRR